MKKVIITIIAVIFVTIVIPVIITEFSAPKENAVSTEPVPSPAADDTMMQL